MSNIRNDCITVSGKRGEVENYFHPIHHRNFDNGLQLFVTIPREKVGESGWFLITPRAVYLDEATVLLRQQGVCERDAIKRYFVYRFFRYELPPLDNETYEVWEKGICIRNKVLNLLSESSRQEAIKFIKDLQPESRKDVNKAIREDLLVLAENLGKLPPIISNVCESIMRLTSFAEDYLSKEQEKGQERKFVVPTPVPEKVQQTGTSNLCNEVALPNKEDPHYHLSVAVLNGRRIQWRTSSGQWIDCENPSKYIKNGWKYPPNTYRIVL